MKPAAHIASAVSPYLSALAPEYAPEIAMGTSALQALNKASGGRLMSRSKIRGAIRNF
jgi:hypothetical protein